MELAVSLLSTLGINSIVLFFIKRYFDRRDSRERKDLERKEELKASISREIDERIQKEWAAREAALTGETDEEQILKVLCLLLAVPAKVLCEKFRWKPIEDENDRKSRLLQFSEAVVKEVNRTFENDNVDIRAIGEEVYEKYGVRFEVR